MTPEDSEMWYKPSESDTPCNTSVIVKIHYVTLVYLIKDISHQFQFGDTNNDFSNGHSTENDTSTNSDRSFDMVVTNIFMQ